MSFNFISNPKNILLTQNNQTGEEEQEQGPLQTRHP